MFQTSLYIRPDMNYLSDKPALEKRTSNVLTTTQSLEDHSAGLLVARQEHVCTGQNQNTEYLMTTSKSEESRKMIHCSCSMPDLE